MGKLTVKNLLAVAVQEIGYREKKTPDQLDNPEANAGNKNWTKYARDVWNANPPFYQGNKNGYDWCTTFVAWCMYKASGEDSRRAQLALCYSGPYGAGCVYAIRYYQQAKRWKNRQGYTPEPGDQIFFGDSADSSEHTGIVLSVQDGLVTTVEGNADNMVKSKSYYLDSPRIIGYGQPIYDQDDHDDTYYDTARYENPQAVRITRNADKGLLVEIDY